jgi:hypothetical protein
MICRSTRSCAPANRSTGRFLIAIGSRRFSLIRDQVSGFTKPRDEWNVLLRDNYTLKKASGQPAGRRCRRSMRIRALLQGAAFELRGQAPKRAPCSATSSGPIPRPR